MTDIPSLLTVLFSTCPPRMPEVGVDPDRHFAAQLEAYGRALASYEIQDIEAAINRFLQGTVPEHNPNFAPSAAMLGVVTKQCRDARLDSEHRAALRHPRLPPPDVKRTPESMARVAALMAKTVEDLGAQKRTEDAAADKRRAEQFARTNERFAPDMSMEAQRERLGRAHWYTLGNDDGEAA